MNPFPSRRGIRGFTLVELLVVIAIIGILAALLLPALNLGKLRAKQSFCENNLSQIGIGFHIFGHDHDSNFPMAVSGDEGGAMEFVENGYLAGDIFYFGFHVFQTLSNSLAEPRILICPADDRAAAPDFPGVQNQNLSYFFGAKANFLDANSILAGDRDLATNSFLQPTILQLGGGSRLRWTGQLHSFKGNMLFADGHVEEWNKAKLAAASGNPSLADLFMPSVAPMNSISSYGGNGNQNYGGSPQNRANNFNSNSGGAIPNNFRPTPSSPPKFSDNHGDVLPDATGAKSNSPAMLTASGNNNELNQNFGASGSQNERFVRQIAPVTLNTQSNAAIASDNSDPAMSPFDKEIVRIFRGAFEWGYLLLLLLLLLYLLYKLRQILRREKNRSGRGPQFPPEP